MKFNKPGKIFSLQADIHEYKGKKKQKKSFEKSFFDNNEPINLVYDDGVYRAESLSDVELEEYYDDIEPGFEYEVDSYEEDFSSDNELIEDMKDEFEAIKETVNEIEEKVEEKIAPDSESKTYEYKTSEKVAFEEDFNASFEDDLKSILNGDKVYDPEEKKVVSSSDIPKQTESEKKAEAKKSVQASDPHDIFNQISKNMQSAKAFDLGEFSLEKTFDELDKQLDIDIAEKERRTRKAETKSETVATTSDPVNLTHADISEDLEKIGFTDVEELSKQALVTKNITVIEQSANDNGYLTNKASKNPDALRVTSIEDFTDKILNNLKSNERIKTLKIIGHGAKGNFSVGAGRGLDSNKEIDSNRTKWEPHLKKLKGKFADDAKIEIVACNVGAGEKGAAKLKELADFFQVTVEAPTGKTYGNCTEEMGSVHQIATPTSAKPNPIETPSDSKKKKIKKTTMSMEHVTPFSLGQIRSVYLHPADQLDSLNTPDDSMYKYENEEFIKMFYEGVDFTEAIDVENLGAKINATLSVNIDGQFKEFYVFADFDYLVPKDDWNNAYSIQWEFKEKLRDLFESKDFPMV